MTAEKMWDEFIKIDNKAEGYEAWVFGGTTEDMPNILAKLVKNGIKTATASAYPMYLHFNESLPKVNGYNVILNTENQAVCITKTTKVYTTPFNEVSESHAFLEGEGDRTLNFWRLVHEKFFTSELKEIGLVFRQDMLVVCEEFQVVYPL